MCGIVGYTGNKQAAPILLEGLSRLEYRGYDSAGIAVRNKEEDPIVIKAKGRLKVLQEKTNNGESVFGTCGIGHTRWATHGEPSETNAHPHVSDDLNVVGVHNGIIENYRELRERLEKRGYTFYSETDTEIAIKAVDYHYRKNPDNPIRAIAHAVNQMRGSYAFAIMFKNRPEEIYAARKDSPLILGRKDGETYLASGVPAILKYTRTVYYIENGQIARLTKGGLQLFNMEQEEVKAEPVEIKWDADAAEKGGYEHFMMKEIHEQPKAVRDTLHSVIKDGEIDLSAAGITEEILRNTEEIYFVACGSAYHVSMVAKNVIEDLARIPVKIELASEFRYCRPILTPKTLVVVISQSGETADSLAALREAKAQGVHTLGIVNVVGSSIARESEHTLYTLAGPEIAVATTKAYSAQLAACYALALEFARIRETITPEKYHALIGDLETLPEKIQTILEDKERLQWFAAQYANIQDAFFIGRGIDYAISMEGSLKLKEISYVHSEAYAAGELKHGTISLIEKGTLVFGIVTQQHLYEKTLSNMTEVKSRGGYIVGVTNYGNFKIEETSDFTIYIPPIDAHFTTSLAVIPLQLMAYYISVSKGLDVDKPRNLAKSVTVE
ncbi:MAG: glutamine--fructose-6-phosphate transaminase (isomerizing) [Erysipelotrichales bacterium]|nr:glutamine--fructose-6-phosphate transaminase (isomerizing) [Erysipelotrichales bacterium]